MVPATCLTLPKVHRRPSRLLIQVNTKLPLSIIFVKLPIHLDGPNWRGYLCLILKEDQQAPLLLSQPQQDKTYRAPEERGALQR